MIEVTEADKAYLAGLLDGEGCLYISRQNRQKLTPEPVYAGDVIITQGEKQASVLTECRARLGQIGSIHASSDKNGNTMYQWRICAKAAEKFIRLIYPYLVVKKQQAEIFLRFRATFDKQGGWGSYITPLTVQKTREECRTMLKAAKHGEVVTVATKRQPKRPRQMALSWD